MVAGLLGQHMAAGRGGYGGRRELPSCAPGAGACDAPPASLGSVHDEGKRRRTPTGKLLFGSQAQRVLLDADCPVPAVEAGR